jgi:hypothetical protein
MNIVDMREVEGRKCNNMEIMAFEKGMGDLLRSSMVIKEIITDSHLGISALMSEWSILEISNHFLAFPYIHKFFPCTYTPRFAPAIRKYFKNAYYCIFVYWY